MHNQNRRRLFFPTGLISLALLPLGMLLFLDTHSIFRDKYALEIIYGEKFRRYKDYQLSVIPPKRCYTDIDITGDSERDNLKMDFATLLVEEIVKTKDKSSGIHFYFGKNARYRAWVRVFDICKRANTEAYIADQDDVWVFSPDPIKPTANGIKVSFMNCGTGRFQFSKEERPIEQNDLTGLIKVFWPLCILFGVMAVIPCLRLIYRVKH